MIKSLHRDDIQVTPFIANKTWNVQNIVNEDALLWINGTESGSLSLTYIDYGDGSTTPVTSSDCSLALLPQDNNTTVNYQHGIKSDSTFFPVTNQYYDSASNPMNMDGTYMSIVYNTNKQLFYNTYDNPTQLWGLENINLNTSTRILTDDMDVFNLKKNQFGEKIVPNSVFIVDNAGEIDYKIIDDGKTNLILDGQYFSTFQTVTFESTL